MANPEISHEDQSNGEQLSENPEIAGEMGFDEALNALVDYASSDLREDSVLMNNIAEARNGEPDALEAVLATVKAERNRLGGGGSETDETATQTLDVLNRVQNALEKHQRDVQDSANRAEQLDYVKATYENKRPEHIKNARQDAHEAINRQPPPKFEFNKTADELANKFGTNMDKMLKGVSYDDVFQNQPELVRVIHNLNADYLKNPDNGQEMFDRYNKDLENRLGGLQGNARNNNIVQGASSSGEVKTSV